jgi:hypothetical protein
MAQESRICCSMPSAVQTLLRCTCRMSLETLECAAVAAPNIIIEHKKKLYRTRWMASFLERRNQSLNILGEVRMDSCAPFRNFTRMTETPSWVLNCKIFRELILWDLWFSLWWIRKLRRVYLHVRAGVSEEATDNLRSSIFWEFTQRRLVVICQTYAAGYSEILVLIWIITWRHIEDELYLRVAKNGPICISRFMKEYICFSAN